MIEVLRPYSVFNMTKREAFFMEMVDLQATRSRDHSAKVGCVITSADHVIISTGWNDFPRGVDDTEDNRRTDRPLKYWWTEHAERNAVYNCARSGVSPVGGTMYIRWFPCCDCARAIIQAGIKRLCCHVPDWNDKRWGEQFLVSHEMLCQAGVDVRFLKPTESGFTF